MARGRFFFDGLGYFRPLKWLLVLVIGWITWPGLFAFNRLEITGREKLENLPAAQVLFVSNHHTYFMDVIAMLHAMHSADHRYYLLAPKWVDIFYIAARETMQKKGIIPKILAYTGAVCIDRTWREDGMSVERIVRRDDVEDIVRAMRSGWVITFPQGTTAPGAPGRKGTAHLIREYRPIVVPVVIGGFRDAFDKTGLRPKKRSRLTLDIRPTLAIDYEASVEDILEQVMKSIV